jgi:hypothetical protein
MNMMFLMLFIFIYAVVLLFIQFSKWRNNLPKGAYSQWVKIFPILLSTITLSTLIMVAAIVIIVLRVVPTNEKTGFIMYFLAIPFIFIADFVVLLVLYGQRKAIYLNSDGINIIQGNKLKTIYWLEITQAEEQTIHPLYSDAGYQPAKVIILKLNNGQQINIPYLGHELLTEIKAKMRK